MKKYQKILPILAALVLLVVVAGWYLSRHPVPVLQPAGAIGYKERNLIYFTVGISLAIVVPVFGLLAYFGWKYREGNKKAKYSPEQEGDVKAEAIWWMVPTFIMVLISVITWQSSYALDPYKPLPSTTGSLHVQVVAMDWKWLFLYPDQKVASVNQAVIPANQPVDFEITSDTVMSSFWVPALGGQMYAMTGMSSHLNLVAEKTGSFNGSAANISGEGFARMRFSVQSVPLNEYKQWLQAGAKSANTLDEKAYQKLAQPSTDNPVQQYKLTDPYLYDSIMMKYMMPTTHTQTTEANAGGHA